MFVHGTAVSPSRPIIGTEVARDNRERERERDRRNPAGLRWLHPEMSPAQSEFHTAQLDNRVIKTQIQRAAQWNREIRTTAHLTRPIAWRTKPKPSERRREQSSARWQSRSKTR